MRGEKRGSSPGEMSSSEKSGITRRAFLERMGIVVATVATSALPACDKGDLRRLHDQKLKDRRAIDSLGGIVTDKVEEVFGVESDNEDVETGMSGSRESNVEIREELDDFSFEKVFNDTSDYASSGDRRKRRREIPRIITSEKAMVYAIKFRGSEKAQKDHFKRSLEDKEYATQVHDCIIKYCNKYNVPYDIAFDVGANESGFDQDKKSSVDAVGVFQVMKIAAKDVGFKSGDREDIEKNIEMGIKYLAKLFDIYKKWDIALVIYSTGEGNLKKMIAKKKGMDIDDVEEYLKRDIVDLITLYSREFDKLGGKHPFQYPLQAKALGGMGRKILEGKYPSGKIPLVMTDAEFIEALEKYPSLKGRIEKKKAGGFNGAKFIKNIKRKVAELAGGKKRLASKY